MTLEPRVPLGLGTLTPALERFVELILVDLDSDLIAAAAVESEEPRTIFALLRAAKKAAKQRKTEK